MAKRDHTMMTGRITNELDYWGWDFDLGFIQYSFNIKKDYR